MNAGIDGDTLTWTHVADQQWSLEGTCPRCGDHFGQYFDFEVVVSRALGADLFTPEREQLTTQVVCLCDVDPPHRKGTKGCGAGKGLEITVAAPQPPGAGG